MITMQNDPSVDARRGRVGFILGKSCDYLSEKYGAASVVRALVEAGFEIHTTAQNCPELYGIAVTTHGHIPPLEFSKMLRSFAFIVGLGDPIVSPTPIEGLYAGTCARPGCVCVCVCVCVFACMIYIMI